MVKTSHAGHVASTAQSDHGVQYPALPVPTKDETVRLMASAGTIFIVVAGSVASLTRSMSIAGGPLSRDRPVLESDEMVANEPSNARLAAATKIARNRGAWMAFWATVMIKHPFQS
jgi:hypothetical protein